MTSAEEIAQGLFWYERRALLASDECGLTDKQTAGCTLAVRQDLVDYSFRPARFRTLGLEVRKLLENPHD